MKGKKSGVTALVLAMACSLSLLTACVENPPPGAVYVNTPPPSAEVEVIGTAPSPDHVWIRGYHRWDGSAYSWNAGRWEARPRAGAVWVDGSWNHHSRGWYWREGRWR